MGVCGSENCHPQTHSHINVGGNAARRDRETARVPPPNTITFVWARLCRITFDLILKTQEKTPAQSCVCVCRTCAQIQSYMCECVCAAVPRMIRTVSFSWPDFRKRVVAGVVACLYSKSYVFVRNECRGNSNDAVFTIVPLSLLSRYFIINKLRLLESASHIHYKPL